MTSTELQTLADTLFALSEKCEVRGFLLKRFDGEPQSKECKEAFDCAYYFEYLQRELKDAFSKITDAVESLKFLESKGETL